VLFGTSTLLPGVVSHVAVVNAEGGHEMRRETRLTERQFREADAAVERAVAAFIRRIDRIEERHATTDRGDGVPFQIIEEVMLLKLCHELAKRLDWRRTQVPPAILKLSNALADYRDSHWEDRG
jgi:hypothetical protein